MCFGNKYANLLLSAKQSKEKKNLKFFRRRGNFKNMMESIPGAYKYYGARRCVLSNGRKYWLCMLKYLAVLYLLQNFRRREAVRIWYARRCKNVWVFTSKYLCITDITLIQFYCIEKLFISKICYKKRNNTLNKRFSDK